MIGARRVFKLIDVPFQDRTLVHETELRLPQTPSSSDRQVSLFLLPLIKKQSSIYKISDRQERR